MARAAVVLRWPRAPTADPQPECCSPCIVDGVDQGPRLQQMGFGYFYMMLTFPVGVVLFGLRSIALITIAGLWRRPIIRFRMSESRP